MISYVSGVYLPHGDAKISIDDRSIMFGDSVFDIARTFGGEPFKLDQHLERLGRSMRYVELDADGLLPEIRQATHEVLARNAAEIAASGDVFVEQVITRGRVLAPGEGTGEPTVIVKLRPVYFAAFAPFYDSGVDLHVSLLTRSFAGPLDPRAKAANRLANTRAELKGERMRHLGKGHWTLIFNEDGSIAETNSANLCIVTDGRLMLPPSHEALGGISLDTLTELAQGLGIEVFERRLAVYDVLNADEAFITATSFSVLPVAAIDGIPLAGKRDVYDALLRGWMDLVDFDFVSQAREREGLATAATSRT